MISSLPPALSAPKAVREIHISYAQVHNETVALVRITHRDHRVMHTCMSPKEADCVVRAISHDRLTLDPSMFTVPRQRRRHSDSAIPFYMAGLRTPEGSDTQI